MYNVAIIVGSLRKESINKKLAKALMRVGKDRLRFTLVGIDDIPLYNQDMESDLPAPVARLKAEIAAADAVLFVTPEYNRSMPGVLKNLLDWGSRPYGQNVWAGKPAAIAGISPSPVGTAVAQSHLRSVLSTLDMVLLSQPEVYFTDRPGGINDDGTITDESTEKYLLGFISRFAGWIGGTR